MTRPHHRIITTATLAVALDLVTKAWAERTLEPYQPVPLVGDSIRLTLNYNAGVAFGMGNTGAVWPTILTGGIITGLIGWLAIALRRDTLSAEMGWPIGLILGGALGNFVDRLPDRRVTDFVDVGIGAARWPTFNLADVCITVGVALALLVSLIEQRSVAAPADA
jgi:signal peptidase II